MENKKKLSEALEAINYHAWIDLKLSHRLFDAARCGCIEHQPFGPVDYADRYLFSCFPDERERSTGVVRIVVRADLIATLPVEGVGVNLVPYHAGLQHVEQ